MKYVTNTKWKTETFSKIHEIIKDELSTSVIMNIIENEYLKLYKKLNKIFKFN